LWVRDMLRYPSRVPSVSLTSPGSGAARPRGADLTRAQRGRTIRSLDTLVEVLTSHPLEARASQWRRWLAGHHLSRAERAGPEPAVLGSEHMCARARPAIARVVEHVVAALRMPGT